MDRQEFNRLVFEKLSALNPSSINFVEKSEDALTIEVVSNDFVGISVLKRINKVFDLLSSTIELVDFHVDFITLTVNEKENGSDEQMSETNNTANKKSGYAAHQSI